MNSVQKILICSAIAVSFSHSVYAESSVGSCFRDPNAIALQNEWKHYSELMQKRAKINTKVMAPNLKMDAETVRLIKSISEIENLIKIVDELEKKFMKKSFVDTRFNDTVSSPDFIRKLETKEMDAEIQASDLPFKNDPHFYELLESIRTELTNPDVKEALDLFRTYDLGILEASYRESAKHSLQLIRKKGGTKEMIRSWVNDPPYLKNIPLPPASMGAFAVRYREFLSRTVAAFVMERKVELAEAKKVYPKIKQAEVDEMNSVVPPTENNSFDEYISKANDVETAAIDGVARTLWGEATSCQVQGLAQFEAISRIIADRSLAVCRSINEQKGLEQKNTQVREKNWMTFLKNWAGIKSPAPGMKNKAYAKLKGLSDFGRKENSQIHCAAQVISKKNQFSVWNSYTLKKFNTGIVNKNIPSTAYEIKGPQAVNDDKALIRILCPEFQTEEQRKLWSQAVGFATEIVKTPDALAKRIAWPKNEDVYFYTHEAALRFAKEVKIDHVLINGQKMFVKKKARGLCNQFRLFVPKMKGIY
jgi:hypothetical protein